MSNLKRCSLLLTFAFAAACGYGASEPDPTGSRGDPLNGPGTSPPSNGCAALNEQQCLNRPSRCEPVYQGGICPQLACVDPANCNIQCPPRQFVGCRTRCDVLGEAACLARADCTATYTEVCPAIGCADPQGCPDLCQPGFLRCTAGGSGSGGSGVTGGGGVTGSGSSGP